MDMMIRIAREFIELSELPVMVRTLMPDYQKLKTETRSCAKHPVILLQGHVRLLDAGVKIMGGCCGTTPEHIRRLKPVIDKWNEILDL